MKIVNNVFPYDCIVSTSLKKIKKYLKGVLIENNNQLHTKLKTKTPIARNLGYFSNSE